MKKLLMKIASVSLCASMLLCMNVSAVAAADEGAVRELGSAVSCENNVPGTVNGVPACTDTDGDLHICENNFPDAAFREYLLSSDDNNDGYFSPQEYLDIVTVSVSSSVSHSQNEVIHSMQGIEFFPSLDKLDCSGNQIKVLDLSHNKALTFLSCTGNQLTDLDVSSNVDLVTLWCAGNQLSKLDVTQNKSLTDLFCTDNQLTELDVSNNHALTDLDCGLNQLTDLDVSNNLLLEELFCSVNPLSELDLSNNASLKYLSCLNNQLTELDVSRNPGLLALSCGGNQLTELDLSKNVELTYLTCSYNQLSTLDLSSNTALTDLNCHNNQLTTLDLSNNTKLSRWSINDQKRISLELFDYNGSPAVYLGDAVPSEDFSRILSVSKSTFDPETGIAVIDSEDLSDIYYVYNVGKRSATQNLTVGIDITEATDRRVVEEEHRYIINSDNNKHWKECACGSIIESGPHTFEWKIDKLPSEDEPGLKHEQCSVCWFVRSNNTVIDPTHVHTGVIRHDNLIATCSTKGNIEYWTCSSPKCDGKYYSDADCNTEISVIETDIDPDNHGECEILGTVEPSCTKAGYTGDTYCKDCNAKISDGEVIPESAHSLIKTEAKDAAEDSNGNIEYYTCSVCNKIFKDSEATEELSLDDTVVPYIDTTVPETDEDIWLYDHIDDDVKSSVSAVVSETEFIYSETDCQAPPNTDDAIWLFDHIDDNAVKSNVEKYDLNGDGAVNRDDASYLLLCALMPDKYELKKDAE